MNNSRNRRPGRGRFWHHVIATSFAAMLLVAGGVGHALAQEDDDDELPDTKFLKSVLHGLGLKKDGERSGITYQERPPLVVPPTRDLPPPQSADAVRGNAAWPKDQDEQRKRQAAASRRKDVRVGDFWEDLGRQSTPSELRKGAATPKDDAMKRKPQEVEDAMRQYKPSELGYTGGLFGSVTNFFGGVGSQESTPFETEPPRASLTDPPIGYRSPSPAQPYGVSSSKSQTKGMTPEDRVSSGGDTPASK